jgi:hypothetical protein
MKSLAREGDKAPRMPSSADGSAASLTAWLGATSAVAGVGGGAPPRRVAVLSTALLAAPVLERVLLDMGLLDGGLLERGLLETPAGVCRSMPPPSRSLSCRQR